MEDVQLNSFTTVADANKCKMYMKNFGEFYNDQIGHANSIILSRTAGISEQKLETCVKLLREHNATATIITTPWDVLSGAQILEAMEHRNTLDEELRQLAEETEHEHHHHHDEDCDCHEHHHDHDHEEHEHHHDHDHDHEEHGHEHHHDHDEHCTCGCHDHDHDHHDHEHGHDHHHHHADEIFTSWGIETTRKFTKEEIEQALVALNDSETYGTVLRAKGIVTGADGTWLHFDYVPEESEVREGAAMVTGRLCVIGSNLKEDALAQLFA